jgi:hypothetical protein
LAHLEKQREIPVCRPKGAKGGQPRRALYPLPGLTQFAAGSAFARGNESPSANARRDAQMNSIRANKLSQEPGSTSLEA